MSEIGIVGLRFHIAALAKNMIYVLLFARKLLVDPSKTTVVDCTPNGDSSFDEANPHICFQSFLVESESFAR